MSRWFNLALRPFRILTRPLQQAIKRKLVRLIELALEPTIAEIRMLNFKMDRILDINLAPNVLRDFRLHNETLRTIQADCDLIREMNPMFNSFLRDLMRLQLKAEELAWRLEQGESWYKHPGPEASSEREAA